MSRRMLLISVLLTPCVFPSHAFDHSDTEGVWTSVLRDSNRGVLELDLRIINGFGTLIFKSRRWADLGFATCSYAFVAEKSGIDNVVINPAASIGENCPQSFRFAVQRASVDELTLSLDKSLQQVMGGLGETQLFGTLRPLRDHERRADIPDLDILGIAPGMHRSEVEDRLDDLGFEQIKTSETTYQGGFESASEHWARTPDADGVNTDHMSLGYTAVSETVDVPERLITIARVNEPQEPLSLAVFDQAVTDKYGPAPRFGDRAFFRDGRPVTRQGKERCKSQVHQDIRFTYTAYNRYSTAGGATKNFSVNCGVEVTAGATGDRNTGAVSSYRIIINDIDMIWEDFWNRWSSVEGANIAAQYQALTSLGTDKPEL